jgi:hypothetical protein
MGICFCTSVCFNAIQHKKEELNKKQYSKEDKLRGCLNFLDLDLPKHRKEAFGALKHYKAQLFHDEMSLICAAGANTDDLCEAYLCIEPSIKALIGTISPESEMARRKTPSVQRKVLLRRNKCQ